MTAVGRVALFYTLERTAYPSRGSSIGTFDAFPVAGTVLHKCFIVAVAGETFLQDCITCSHFYVFFTVRSAAPESGSEFIRNRRRIGTVRALLIFRIIRCTRIIITRTAIRLDTRISYITCTSPNSDSIVSAVIISIPEGS